MSRSIVIATCVIVGLALTPITRAQLRTIEIVADSDSRYKLDGHPDPVLKFKPGEEILFRVVAHRARTWNRDGSVHGFALLRKDGSRVDGWNLFLKEGTNTFTLKAPSEPGQYEVVCTVVCSSGHEQMHMKVIVAP